MVEGYRHHISLFSRLGFKLLLTTLFLHVSPAPLHGAQKVSLKQYPTLSYIVPNPVDLTKLSTGKTFQVTNHDFILQFFFNGKDIFGIVFKRDRKHPLLLRWCFFRSCEDSPYDITSIIAKPYKPPFDGNFFSVKFPRGLQYHFQGLEFSSPK